MVLPLADDNQTIVKERMYIDQADPNILHNDMTVFDHALIRPWAVAKRYQRVKAQFPNWPEDMCVEGSGLVRLSD